MEDKHEEAEGAIPDGEGYEEKREGEKGERYVKDVLFNSKPH